MNQSELKPQWPITAPALKPILFSALILISGIVIGAGLTLIITGNLDAQKSLPPGPEYMSGRMVKRIAGELKLSPQQQDQLKPIIQRHMKAMDDIRRQASPEISKELKQMNEEILNILDEPQKEIWKDRVQRMQEHFTRMRHRHSPGDSRRNESGSDFHPRRDRRHQPDRFHERHPEGQVPPEEKPPIDDTSPPHELNPLPEAPPEE